MSGGAYNYASIRQVEASGPSDEHIALIEDLAQHAGTECVAARARAALDKWRKAAALMAEVADEWEALRPVLRAVEWCRSGDSGPDDVTRAVPSVPIEVPYPFPEGAP